MRSQLECHADYHWICVLSMSVLALGVCVIGGLCLLPLLVRYLLNSFMKIRAEMHGLRLQAQK